MQPRYWDRLISEPRLQQRFGFEDQGDGLFGGGGDGGEVAHLAAFARAELLVEVQADSGDGEGAVEVRRAWRGFGEWCGLWMIGRLGRRQIRRF